MIGIDLTQRQQELLERSIEDYINNFAPIASGTIQSKTQGKVSPATVRTDLKILEQMGYLKQVHTSGGRIPTTKAYRFYLSTAAVRSQIKRGELGGVIEYICKKLEDKLNPVINEKLVVEGVEVIPLVDGSTMVLIKTEGGSIAQTIESTMTRQQCDETASALTIHCRGKMLKEIEELMTALYRLLSTTVENRLLEGGTDGRDEEN